MSHDLGSWASEIEAARAYDAGVRAHVPRSTWNLNFPSVRSVPSALKHRGLVRMRPPSKDGARSAESHADVATRVVGLSQRKRQRRSDSFSAGRGGRAAATAPYVEWSHFTANLSDAHDVAVHATAATLRAGAKVLESLGRLDPTAQCASV